MAKAKEKPGEEPEAAPTSVGIVNQFVPVAGCKPHPENYNRHDDWQIEDLRVSLKRFGQVRSIVVQDAGDGTFLLVAGHGVHEAARRQKFAELRADVIPKDWTPAQVLAYLAADNEIARHGMPDDAQLAAIVAMVEAEADAELARLAAGGEDRLKELLAMARAVEPAEDPGAKMDKAEELAEQWGTAGGQLWVIPSRSVYALLDGKVTCPKCGKEHPVADPYAEDQVRTEILTCECGHEFDTQRQYCHYLLCGDSTIPADVEHLMAGEQATLMATDPPYGVAYDGNAHRRATDHGGIVYEPIANDDLDAVQLRDFLTDAFRVWRRFVDERASWYVWHASSTRGAFIQALDAAGIEVHQEIIWAKEMFQLSRADYHWQHEPCLYGWGKAHRFFGGRNQSTIWRIDRETDHLHPTTKPVELWIRPMENNTKPGEITVDAFVGSGTALVAAEQTGRRGRAMELGASYVAVVLERLAGMGLEPRLVSSSVDGEVDGD